MIEFSCASCGQAFKVKDDWAGKRARCKGCGQAVTVPNEAAEYGNDSREAGAAWGNPEEATDSGSLTDAERRLLRRGIIAAVILIPLLLAILFLPGMFRQRSYNRAFSLVEPKVRDGIESVLSRVHSFEFDSANRDLLSLKDAVTDAEVSEDQRERLNGRLAAAQAEVQRDKADFERKREMGFVLKGGQLLSPEEQREQAKRERDEQTAKTAELWRQYKQKQEAERNAAAEQEAAARAEQQRQQQVLQQQQRQQVEQQAEATAEWQRHVRTMSEFTEMLDKTLRLMAKGDGISYPDLVTCSKLLKQYAENIYIVQGDEIMDSNATKAKRLSNWFAIAAASWATARNASKTGPADPSYDFNIQTAKDSIAERDKWLNGAAQEGKLFSDSVHAMAANAGIPIKQ